MRQQEFSEQKALVAYAGGLPPGITFWQGPPLPVTPRLIHSPA